MNGSILYGIGAVVVVVAMGLWISVIVRRAARINQTSSSRLNSDLSRLAVDPEHASSATPAGPAGSTSSSSLLAEPVMFSDDLPTEISDIATAALVEEKVIAPVPAGTAAAQHEAPTDAVTPADEVEQVATESVSKSSPEPAVTPVSAVEAKLAKLKDLHARGVITDEEHSAARLNALSE